MKMITKLSVQLELTSQKTKKNDQISPPVLYHAEKATEVFKAIRLHAHVHGEKNYLSHSKLKKNHLPHMQFILKHLHTHNIYIRITIIVVVVVNTHRERSPEKRSKDRNLVATEIRKKEKKEN